MVLQNALLGYTGFVGSNLAEQLKDFDEYSSQNLKDLQGKEYKNIYCCCVPGVKYIANKDPVKDLENINNILGILKNVKCDNFFLVSSQDCNSTLTSGSEYICNQPTAYGHNRYIFEEMAKKIFSNVYILRIGCLFGKNLRKNIIFDLLNNHYLDHLTEDFTMQLYDLNDLLVDLEYLKDNDIHLLNRFGEPTLVSEIIKVFNECGFNYKFNLKPKDGYNNSGFLYNKQEQLNKLKKFILKFKN